jgi:hypothetical protein
MSFLPKEYKVPASGGSYTKLEEGENRLRFLSNPLLMWVKWDNGKVTRSAYDPDNKPKSGGGERDSVHHAWAILVFNYTTEKIEIFEESKPKILEQIAALAESEDWGHPSEYDIKINKKKSAKTFNGRPVYDFIVTPTPKKEASSTVAEAYAETPVDLENLLKGESPFLNGGGSSENTSSATAKSKVVTVDNWVEGDEAPAGYKVKDGALVKNSLPKF